MKTRIEAPAGLPFVDIERDFDAPRELLYRAYTEPELIAQWLGPRGYEMVIDHWDARSGGAYRYIHRNPAGEEFAFHGVFHSLVIDHMVQTFEFEGAPGHVSLDALVFEDLGGGRTRIRTHTVFQTVEGRDGMVAAGMERGVVEGFDRLDELVGRLAAPTH